MKRYYLVESDLFEDADALRDIILDGLGYPLKVETDPELLKVAEIEPPPGT